MTDAIGLAAAFAAGILLGALFFGGLWWTTHKGLLSANPALWFCGSLLLRGGVTAAGFYFAAGSDWRRLLACLGGFLIARQAVLRLADNIAQRPAIEEMHHES